MSPADIAVISEEAAALKASKILVPIDPCLPQPRAPDRAAVLYKSLEAAKVSPSSTSSPRESRKRSISPMTAQLVDTSAKRTRYLTMTSTTSAVNARTEPMDSPESMRQTIAALRERENLTSEKVVSLQRASRDFKAQATSLGALWNATATELSALRDTNRRLRESLEAKSDGVASEALVIALREERLAYRNLAMHVYQRFSAVESALTGEAEDEADGETTVSLTVVTKLMDVHLKGIRQTMSQVLGDDWEDFEAETQPHSQGSSIYTIAGRNDNNSEDVGGSGSGSTEVVEGGRFGLLCE
jgi:hypothetical protein